MAAGLFDDPKKGIKSWAAQYVIAESEIRKAIQFSNHIDKAAKHIHVSPYRFKIWADRYLDSETGLTLLELQRKNLLIEKSKKVGSKPKKRGVKGKGQYSKLDITEEQIRKAMEITNSNKEASEVLEVSYPSYKKYAKAITDEETGMTLYELQHEKWRKVNYERFMARKESGWFERLAERKRKWEENKFKKGECPYSERPEEWKWKGLQLSEEVIRNAMKNTRSNREAAEWIRVSYKTWKKYAKSYVDQQTGRTLFDLHVAKGGKGVPKVRNIRNQANPRALILGYQLIKGQHCTPKRIDELAARLMKDGRLGFCCKECGFSQKRPIDMKIPLMLNFINGDRTDWTEENLRWLCYNCSFLLSLDSFTKSKRQILQAIPPESPDATEELESFYKIDEFYLEHLKHLGVKDMAENVKAQEDRLKDHPKPTSKDMTHPDLEDLIDYR